MECVCNMLDGLHNRLVLAIDGCVLRRNILPRLTAWCIKCKRYKKYMYASNMHEFRHKSIGLNRSRCHKQK